MLCGRKFKQITTSHLNKVHKISVKEYKNMFPDCSIFTDVALKKLSIQAASNPNIGFRKGHIINKGKEPWNKNKKGLQVGWCKGLTKYTDCRLLEAGKKGSITRVERMKTGEIKKPSGELNGMYGKKLTEEHKLALWSGWKSHHTKPELSVLNSFYGLKYTGDGSLWITFTDGVHKNPDIVFNNYKIAIEVFGDYWHKGENPENLIKKYNEVGWRCLVLWEHEIQDLNDKGILCDEIDRFINYDRYEPCMSSCEENYGINDLLLLNEKGE